MTPSFHAFLVNGRCGDPALFVDMRFFKRAVLFDLGDLHALEPRKMLRLSDVFVTHAHIDHFIGFDRLLRVLLGRDSRLRLFGPDGFIDRVASKLGGYSWNLVERFTTNLVLDVSEVAAAGQGRAARFQLKNRFRCEDMGDVAFDEGTLYDDGQITLEFAIVDHGIPCLAFALREPTHVNIWRNRLDRLGLTTGPWLRELKSAIIEGAPDDTMIALDDGREPGGKVNRLPLGLLRREVARIVPGQKLAYATDIAPTEANLRTVERLAKDADTLFIEATFARADAELATARDHLTTDMAGRVAAAAGARRVEPFHFSPRYDHEGAETELANEVEEAFRQGLTE